MWRKYFFFQKITKIVSLNKIVKPLKLFNLSEMKSKKMFGVLRDDIDDASTKGKKRHKLPPVKRQKSNKKQFFKDLDEFDEKDDLETGLDDLLEDDERYI